MSQDVERWKRELTEAGWTEASATAWWDPTGGLHRGPYGAWKELQRRKGGETVSHDTQVKQEAPERIYIHPTSAEYHVNPWPLEPTEYIEYVRADLLATVRREAFKEAITLVQSVTNENDLDDGGFFEAGFIAARTKSIDALIEASATEKGEMNG